MLLLLPLFCIIHHLLPTSLPISIPNTIHHSRLCVCLPDSLDLTRYLSILFWTRACEYAGSHDFAFVDTVEISSLRSWLWLLIIIIIGVKLLLIMIDIIWNVNEQEVWITWPQRLLNWALTPSMIYGLWAASCSIWWCAPSMTRGKWWTNCWP